MYVWMFYLCALYVYITHVKNMYIFNYNTYILNRYL